MDGSSEGPSSSFGCGKPASCSFHSRVVEEVLCFPSSEIISFAPQCNYAGRTQVVGNEPESFSVSCNIFFNRGFYFIQFFLQSLSTPDPLSFSIFFVFTTDCSDGFY